MTYGAAAGRCTILLLLVAVTAGCANRPSRGAAAAADRRIEVQVENNHWSTVVVYAVINGQSRRMGEVYTGQTTQLFTPAGVDPSIVEFRLRVDPIGQREVFRSGALRVHSRSRVLLTVENNLQNSHVRIS